MTLIPSRCEDTDTNSAAADQVNVRQTKFKLELKQGAQQSTFSTSQSEPTIVFVHAATDTKLTIMSTV